MNARIPITGFWNWIVGQPSAGVAASVIRLERRELARRGLGPGGKLQCVKGVLWITVDGDDSDVILREGAIYVADRRIRVLIEALEDSVLSLRSE